MTASSRKTLGLLVAAQWMEIMSIVGFSEAWADTILHAPWTASWTAEAAEGLLFHVSLSHQADRWSETKWKSNTWSTLLWWMYVWFEKKKQKDKPGLALRWICYHLISSLVATFINYLKPRKACFIQLFVFTRYRCGSQVLLAYKRLTWRQKREM